MNPRYSHIGDKIRDARIKKKLSQDELARRVGAKGGRFTVIRWEQGLHRPTEYADSLVRELGLDPALFSDDEDADSPLSSDETSQFFSLLRKVVSH